MTEELTAEEPDSGVAAMTAIAQAAEPTLADGVRYIEALRAKKHPDTIALRACRADKEELLNGVVKYWVEQHDAMVSKHNDQLDRALKAERALESARAERDTALARIAELEAERFEQTLNLREALASASESKESARNNSRVAELEDEARRKDAYYQTQGERIAELETQHDAVSTEWRKAETRIDQAVAELKYALKTSSPERNDWHIQRALQVLNGGV